MAKHDLAFWTQQADKIADTTNPLTMPYHVALDEARDCANFVDDHWESSKERPGLQDTENKMPRAVAEEIRSLIRSTQQAQTELLLLVDPAVASHGERARFLVDELESHLEFTLDDDVHEEADDKFAQLNEFHSQDGQRSSALAQALLDYGTLAGELKDRMVEMDKSFDPALIDEALGLAKTLQQAPEGPKENEKIRETRTLRNRLLRLLQKRVGLVRKTAAHVYRRQPELVRKVTSAHERRRRAEVRRAKKGQPQ